MQRQQVGSHRELQSEQVPLRQLLGFFVWGGEQDTWVSRMNLFFFPFFLLCFHPSHLQINKEKRKNSLLDRQTDRLNLTYPWRKKEKFADANIFRPFCFFPFLSSLPLFSFCRQAKTAAVLDSNRQFCCIAFAAVQVQKAVAGG